MVAPPSLLFLSESVCALVLLAAAEGGVLGEGAAHLLSGAGCAGKPVTPQIGSATSCTTRSRLAAPSTARVPVWPAHCAGRSVRGHAAPLDMYIMLDQWLDTEPRPRGTSGRRSRAALGSFVQQRCFGCISVGSSNFPLPPGASDCSLLRPTQTAHSGRTSASSSLCFFGLGSSCGDSCNAGRLLQARVEIAPLRAPLAPSSTLSTPHAHHHNSTAGSAPGRESTHAKSAARNPAVVQLPSSPPTAIPRVRPNLPRHRRHRASGFARQDPPAHLRHRHRQLAWAAQRQSRRGRQPAMAFLVDTTKNVNAQFLRR